MNLILFSITLVLATALNGAVPSLARAQDAPSGELLGAVAEKLNQRTPIMVDDQTELTSISAEPGAIVYHYRLVRITGSAIVPAQLTAAAHPIVARKACTNTHTRQDFLDRGVAMRYVYFDKDAQFITSFDVTAADC